MKMKNYFFFLGVQNQEQYSNTNYSFPPYSSSSAPDHNYNYFDYNPTDYGPTNNE